MKKSWNIKSQIALLAAAMALLIAAIEIGMIVSAISGSRNDAQTELENLLQQVENDVVLYCADVEAAADHLYNSPRLQSYFTESSPLERYVISQYVQDITYATLYGSQSIEAIRILDANFRISTAGADSGQAIFFKVNREYGLFDLDLEQSLFTRVYMDEAMGKPYLVYLRPVYPSGAYLDPEQKKLFYFLCRLDALQERIGAVVSSLTDLELVVADGDVVILSNKPDLVNTPLAESRFFADSARCKTLSREVEPLNWTVYLSVPWSQLNQKGLSALRDNLVMAGLSLLLLLLLALWITQNLTNPILRLSRDINALYGDAASGHVQGGYGLQEVNDVALYINSMLERIRRTNDSLMEVQERLHQSAVAKKEAELAFYRTQINPHFLYNTLECMRSIGQAYNIPEIQTISVSMAKIFRYSIRAGDLVTLAEELACVSDYFEIIRIRFLDKFQLRIQVPEELQSLRAPKMVLQPLAENAVSHGLNGKREGGRVEITARREGECLRIEIRDNGRGIEPFRLQELNRRLRENQKRKAAGRVQGVALDNINRRIRLDFGEEYGIALESEAGQGTAAIVTLPVLNGE